jgi:hypothetical protein
MRQAALVLVLAMALGCGDGIDCPDDLGLRLISPDLAQPLTLADDIGGDPGVQVTLRFESILQAGEMAELTVTSPSGGENSYPGLVAEDGEVAFESVTLPTGEVELVVAASSRHCGRDERWFAASVIGPACSFRLAEDALDSDFHEVGVLIRETDSDPVAPGFQAHAELTSEPGFEVELFVNEVSAGISTAAEGNVVLPVSLAQGEAALRAECRGGDGPDSAATLTQTYFVDTIAPICELESPADGAVITGALDEEPAAGIQVTLRGRVTADDVAGTPTEFRAGFELVTGSAVDQDGLASAQISFLDDGALDLEFRASDRAGNPCGDAAAVDVILDVLQVSFDDPVASGVVGPEAGDVVGGALELSICGAVSEPADEVEVSIDGAAPIVAELTGTTFCLPAPVSLSESPPAHQLTAVATVGERQGMAEVVLIVDLTAPAAPGSLTLTDLDRQSIRIDFVAPDDGESGVDAYQLRVADRAITAGNFSTVGIVVPPPAPAPPGTPQSLVVESLRAGRPTYVAVVAIDQAGNRSLLATAEPVALRFDATAAITAGAADGRSGAALAGGRFDADATWDLAVGAPRDDGPGAVDAGRVRLFSGGPSGIGGPADVTLNGVTDGSRFGAALAVLDWNGDGEDDLAVGAPESGSSGRVYLFLGPIAAGPADVVITVAPGSDALAGGEIGTSLAAADFDGDGGDDLVIGAPGADGDDGAVVVLFATAGATIALDEDDAGGPAGFFIAEPRGLSGGRFGQYVHGLGPTRGPGDGDDDIGVAYQDENRLFVLRGRAGGATGLDAFVFDPDADLELQNDAADPTTGFGAAMAGLEDQSGDGVRELVVGAWRQGRGRVRVIVGGLTGVRPADGVNVRTTFTAGTSVSNLGVAIASGPGARDVDNDGREDLIFAGDAGRLRLYVFYGGAIPTGTVDAAEARYEIAAPGGFLGSLPASQGLPASLVWAGDTNGDGLGDLAWGDPDAAGFQVLWDE